MPTPNIYIFNSTGGNVGIMLNWNNECGVNRAGLSIVGAPGLESFSGPYSLYEMTLTLRAS